MNSNMPGTIVSEEAKRLKWLKDSADHSGTRYVATCSDGFLVAMLSKDDVIGTGNPLTMLWHISISHCNKDRVPDRLPTWDEMKSAKYQLIHEDICMVLIFPRKKAPYVNVHETCLHLWETKEEIDA